jgi:hypothetical protein
MRSAFKLVLLVSCYLALVDCRNLCSSEPVVASPSPDQAKVAAVVRRNCGATTDFAYELSIGRPKSTPSDTTVVLRFDSGHATDWPDDEKQLVTLDWKSHQQLDVTLQWPVRVFKQVTSSNGVSIRYDYVRGRLS